MVNWCHNRLAVLGPQDPLERFCSLAQAGRQPLSLARLVAQPPDLDRRETVPHAVVRNAIAQGATEAEQVWRQLDERCAEQAVRAALSQDAVALLERLGVSVPDERLGREAWRQRHWGTERDVVFDAAELEMVIGLDPDERPEVRSGSLLRVDDCAVYSFYSAWTPPAAAIRRAAERHPRLRFALRFAEPGTGIAGELRLCGAEGLDEECELAVEDVLPPEERWA